MKVNELLELLNSYKAEGRISDAIVVSRNVFNRNPGNKSIFVTYFELLCSLAKSSPSLMNKRDFAGQADVALAFFSENAELDDLIVTEITEYQQRLAAIFVDIGDAEQLQLERDTKEVETDNEDYLKRVLNLKEALKKTTVQEDFDKFLAEIAMVDSKIDKDALSEKLSNTYDALTKECTDVISSKMREFEKKKNVPYNNKAADSFKKAFDVFSADKKKYTKEMKLLFSMLSETLFAYDASCLFNETLIYYNHVYSYIFNSLDEEGKLALTKCSIECERKAG